MILKLTPEQAANEHEIKRAMERETHGKVRSFRIIKKSIDARGRSISVLLNVEPADNPLKYENRFEYKDVTNRPEVIIVGSGPAGLFCALRLIELNIKPIILERGKEILPRKQDIALQNRNEAFDEESNYCFGQGGAGTFSDGKLYTRSKKRGNNQRIFEIFHAHGAQDEILYEAHPHIGTDRLP
ncbi:MAG: FAD-binding protein, partial [bacterium]|nr:FAD-binding protein [Candidatus Colousia faecequi]